MARAAETRGTRGACVCDAAASRGEPLTLPPPTIVLRNKQSTQLITQVLGG